jgi:DNA-binding MarR family transcriptional regulator
MRAQPADINRYIQQIRLAFQRLRKAGELLHADLDISLSLRAILEWLQENGSQTVPQIAEAKSVSRQHVQKSVDELLARGLAKTLPNPAHKRSVLIDITGEGRRVFKEMQKREAAVISAIAKKSDGEALAQALDHLAAFNGELKIFLTENSDDQPD